MDLKIAVKDQMSDQFVLYSLANMGSYAITKTN